MIADNLKVVTRRIAKCCEKSGCPRDSVKLVAVTKNASINQIEEAIKCGITLLGENRVQDALEKHRIIGKEASWHLVGHLQTNKVREAVRIFDLIHSLDSARLAEEIDKEAAKIGKTQDVLIQVNTSGEETKFGIEPAGFEKLFKEVSLYRNINLKGLMTIAPEVDDPESVRPFFRLLKELGERIQGSGVRVQVLSMGMTNDFEVAIEEGSNMVRLGRAIFE